MLVLAFDTSTPVISVAVSQHDSTLAFFSYSREHSESAHILSAVDIVLSQAGLELGDCAAIACAVGPGSFTGLRVGLATAQGLAEGCDLPVVGVPTLEAYAYAMIGVEGLLCPMIDARKKEVYAAGYRWEGDKLVELWPAKAFSPEKLALQVGVRSALLFGEGAAAYRSQLESTLGSKAQFGPTDLALSNAFRVARLGAGRLAQGGGIEPAGLRPIYGRPSEAELASNKHSYEGNER
jgi:tRNA threonylcarbamoyladenosine biosynthesis protein TsaB